MSVDHIFIEWLKLCSSLSFILLSYLLIVVSMRAKQWLSLRNLFFIAVVLLLNESKGNLRALTIDVDCLVNNRLKLKRDLESIQLYSA